MVLFVNVASFCGNTKQYTGLEKLYADLSKDGLVIIGVPANEFGKQEPGDAGQIGSFCEKNYGVSFQLFDKIDVNGANAHPLYKFLTEEAPGLLGIEAIKWNFTKFLVDRNGGVVKRYAPVTKPEAITDDIEKLL